MKAAKKRGRPEVAPTPFLNSDSIVQLGGHSNKMPVVIDGQEVTVLTDSGAQVSVISTQFCKDLALPIPPIATQARARKERELTTPLTRVTLWRCGSSN